MSTKTHGRMKKLTVKLSLTFLNNESLIFFYNMKDAKEKEKKIKKTKKKIAKEILVAFLEHNIDFAMGIVESFARPHIARGTYYENDSKKEKRHIQQEISRLKQKKFIKERKRGNKLYLHLTEKGKKAALKYQILNCDINLKNKYCVVVFDIPESERKIRDFFRAFLKEANFVYLQQSVWVTQKDIADYLLKLIRAAGAEKWISIIIATSISNFSFE